MAVRRADTPRRSVDPFEKLIRYYRRRLSRKVETPKHRWPPSYLGPTWRIGEDGRFVLPERTIGWEGLAWCGLWLQHSEGEPWRFTDEQARFLLWWYAVDEAGVFVYRDAVLQRLKGWGKDPLAACLMAIEMLGPCRFAEWDGATPLATDNPHAWVQVAAVALDQTKNTMRFFPGLFTREAVRRYRLGIGKELIYAMGDERLIEAVTSSPARLEGARSTFIVLNETHHWDSSNSGHDMADVIERNAVKAPDAAARTLRITNAYEPGQDSVAQRDREAHEAIESGRSLASGLLYDSVEAAPDAPLSPDAAPEVVESIRGDSVWLSTGRIVGSILDPRNPPSRSRRFWYNQITAVEDAWVSPQEWDRLALPGLVLAGNTITVGFDGSTTDDHSALIGCDVEADHLFEIEVWEPRCQTCGNPQPNPTCGVCRSDRPGEVDRVAVDRTVRETFDRYDVVGFYSDLHPWESYVDTWAQDLGEDLVVKAGPRHPIAWDIRNRGQSFTAAVERLHAAVLDGTISHDGSSRFRQHVHNARRAPNNWGISVRKEHRESARKIDSVPAAVLARLARLDYLALPESRRGRRKRSGRVW